MDKPDLAPSDERHILGPGPARSMTELVIREEHLARYAVACAQVDGRLVVEAACGSGYGSERLLAAGARGVLALDLAADAIAYARRRYGQPRLLHLRGDVGRLPLADGSVEAVVQLETIEHVPEPEAAAAEAARVLAPGGVYVVSTPNRLHTAKDDQGRPSDPFHLRELDPDELLELLAPRFGSVQLYGQNRISAVRQQRRRLRGMVQRVVGFAAIERVRGWRDGLLGPLLVRRPSALTDAQQQARMVATNVSGLREYLYMLAVATK